MIMSRSVVDHSHCPQSKMKTKKRNTIVRARSKKFKTKVDSILSDDRIVRDFENELNLSAYPGSDWRKDNIRLWRRCRSRGEVIR
jgi:hypothetical protein